MKKFLSFLPMLGLCVGLAACATTQSSQVGFVQACSAYNAAFATALQLREQGKLNASQINSVTLLDAQVTPICTGVLPASADAATAQITAAVTTLTAEVIIQQAGK